MRPACRSGTGFRDPVRNGPNGDEEVRSRLLQSATVNHPSKGATAVTPRRGSRHLHALLDSLFPGLGHLVAGRRQRAALFGLPTLGLIVFILAILVIVPTAGLIGIALDPATIVIVFGLQALLLVWRAAAVGSSLLDGRFPRLGRRDLLPVAVLAVILIVPHVYAGYATEVAREEADRVIPINPVTAGAWRPDTSGVAEPDPSELKVPSVGPS